MCYWQTITCKINYSSVIVAYSYMCDQLQQCDPGRRLPVCIQRRMLTVLTGSKRCRLIDDNTVRWCQWHIGQTSCEIHIKIDNTVCSDYAVQEARHEQIANIDVSDSVRCVL